MTIQEEAKPISFTLEGIEFTFPHPTELEWSNYKVYKKLVMGMSSAKAIKKVVKSKQQHTLLEHLEVMDDFVDVLLEESPDFAKKVKKYRFTPKTMSEIVMYYLGFQDPLQTEESIQKVIDSLKK